jgi:hypothetical protein
MLDLVSAAPGKDVCGYDTPGLFPKGQERVCR